MAMAPDKDNIYIKTNPDQEGLSFFHLWEKITHPDRILIGFMIIASLSIPMPSPAVGGMPNSSAPQGNPLIQNHGFFISSFSQFELTFKPLP